VISFIRCLNAILARMRGFLPTVIFITLSSRMLLVAQQPLNWAADDGNRVEKLTKEGSRLEGVNLILWFPKSLAPDDAKALVQRLDPAVEGLWRRVGIHDWQSISKGKITYYLCDDAFVSHASGRSAVFVPMARVKDGNAPYLHEATHELLRSKLGPLPRKGADPSQIRPLWFTEGLPDYVAHVVADEVGITEEGPFGTPTISGVDAVCAQRARTADGATILTSVGTSERPEALFTTDRQRFAPTFYSCSFSFTNYLAERVGLEKLVGLFALTPSDMASRLNTLAGKPLAEARTDWLRRLKLQ
jgi:hypothetical protein